MRARVRSTITGLVVGTAIAWSGATARVAAQSAQTTQSAYPTRPVKLVLAFGPGGSVDVIARILGGKIGEAWGQPLIIDNKPGADGDLAGETVARATPDGYTILMTSQAVAVNVTLRPKRAYKIDELAPIMVLAETQGVIVTPSTSDAKTLRDAVAIAKANPGKFDFGSSGIGTSGHLFMELFRITAGVDVVHVPFRNFGQWMTDTLAGRLFLGAPTVPGATVHVKSGKLRALGVTGARRSIALSDVPTVAEAGLPGYAASTWYGLYSARGTPQAVIDRVNAAFKAAMAEPAIASRLTELGVEAVASSPAEHATHLAAEVVRWGKVVREAKIQTE